MNDSHPYDVIVIGAGAAGLLAAGHAATNGAHTLLLEKMHHPGRKIQITGKGRCNVTNTAPLPEFIGHFGANGRFLRHAFNTYFSQDLIELLDALGVPTVTERGGRVFPASGEAEQIVAGLVRWVQDAGVTIEPFAPAERLLVEDGRISGVDVAAVPPGRTRTGAPHAFPARTYCAPSAIVTTGGASYAATGSTGDGYRLAKALGHTVVPIRPALIPLETAGDVAARLQGLSLKNVMVTLWADGKKQGEAFGEMLFTHFGVSGPLILTLSGQAVDALIAGQPVHLTIDLKPALDEARLDERLLRDLDTHGKQQFDTLLKELLPRKLIPVCADHVGIPADKLAHQITAKERRKLRLWLKGFRLDVTRYRPLNEAIVTAGGIALSEVDPHTMQSKLVPGLYFAGEVLDVNADTGGYNLQAAFSTGALAGLSAAKGD